jgi:hypothetical protein
MHLALVAGVAERVVVLETPTAEGTGQGLTHIHFSAPLERFLWDRSCAEIV